MTQIIRNAVHLRRKVILYACNTDTHSVFTPVYIHLSHNRLYLREILYTIDIWTAVCVFEHWELIALCMRTEEVGVREREHFYQRDSAYPAFTNFKLIDKELWLPGKTGRLVTQSLTLRVLRLLFQIASSRFGSLSVRCGCHTETRYANARPLMIQWQWRTFWKTGQLT